MKKGWHLFIDGESVGVLSAFKLDESKKLFRGIVNDSESFEVDLNKVSIIEEDETGKKVLIETRSKDAVKGLRLTFGDREDKQLICDMLCGVLQHTRIGEDLRELEYDEKLERVRVIFNHGGIYAVNVAADSGFALIKDVMNSF